MTSTSLAFFKALVPSVTAGTYASTSSTYTAIYNAVFLYAEGFVDKVSQYEFTNGSLSEQFDRNSGAPLSARDLTWSYASFLTAVARRAGVVPAGWANPAATSVPGSCAATSQVGTYSTVSVTGFPAGQTAKATATSSTFSTPTVTYTRPTPTPCSATAVSVAFTVRKVTNLGQTVKIVGNVDKLGNWDTSKAIALSASSYTSSNPIWTGTVSLSPGQAIQYKYIVANSDNSVVWEADPNRSFSAPLCATSAAESDTWQ